MGLFTSKFGAPNSREPDGQIKSRSQTDFKICKFCKGELILVRENFNTKSRTSSIKVACRICGRDQSEK